MSKKSTFSGHNSSSGSRVSATKCMRRCHKYSISLLFCILSTAFINVSALNLSKPEIKMTAKKVFLNELRESTSGNPILSNKDPNNLDKLLANVIKANPTEQPSSTTSLLKFSKGKWGVIYAPHIKTLGKVLFTNFSVFYEFLDVDKNNEQGIISNVFYDSKIFGKGWLNTKGKVDSVSGTVCRVKWDNIWWNLATADNNKPALLIETERHVLPNLIQKVGTRGFVEEFSKFPVLYLDNSFCVFEFSTFGTKICVERVGDNVNT